MTSNSSIDNKSKMSLGLFLQIPIECIQMEVSSYTTHLFTATTYEVHLMLYSEEKNLSLDISLNKRYTEFQGFYDSLTIRFQNLKFPEFPSKYQIINKTDSRKKYFDSLVKSLLKLASMHLQIKNELFRIIYEFTCSSPDAQVIPLSCEKKIRFFSSRTSSTDSSENISSINNSIDLNKSFDELKSFHERRLTMHHPNENELISKMFQIEEEKDSHMDGWQVLIRYNSDKFIDAYVKFIDHCMFAYESIASNHFFLCVPFWKINFDIFCIKGKVKYYIQLDEIKEIKDILKQKGYEKLAIGETENEFEIKLYHSFDTYDLIIKFPDSSADFNGLISFLDTLESLSSTIPSSSKYISSIDETNSNIYGKLSIKILKVTIPAFEGNIYAKVSLNPYTLKTKALVNKTKFAFNQMFLIPIHNRFESLKCEIIVKTHQGLFQKKTVEEKLAEYSIPLPELLNNYFFPKGTIKVQLENNLSTNNKDSNKITLEYKLANYSSLLSLATKNRNTNILEDMSLYKSDEDLTIKNLLKRMKKMIYTIKEFREYYKTIFRFKYPIYSSLLMIISLLFGIFCDPKYWITHLIIFLICIIFAFSSTFQNYLSLYTQHYIFSLKNPYDFHSPYVTTKVDAQIVEVKKENYLTEWEDKKNILTTIIDPIKNYKAYKKTYHEVLLKFTNFVSAFEKIKNLFLWTDPLLSFYFTIILIALLLVVYRIDVRYILLFSFMKKFLVGIMYYKQKFVNNQEIAGIILKQCFEDWRNENKGNKHKIVITQGSFSKESEIVDDDIICDERFREIIKLHLETHADVLLSSDFLASVTKVNQIKEEVSKSGSLLKIKKESKLFQYTNNNANIYHQPVDIEDIFYYFIQNVKSDYYISKYSLHEKKNCNTLCENENQRQ